MQRNLDVIRQQGLGLAAVSYDSVAVLEATLRTWPTTLRSRCSRILESKISYAPSTSLIEIAVAPGTGHSMEFPIPAPTS